MCKPRCINKGILPVTRRFGTRLPSTFQHRIWLIWMPIPVRIFSLTEFSDHLKRHKHKSHFVVFITSFLHLNKEFFGSSKVIFVKISQNLIKSPLKSCLFSQISVHSLWYAWISLDVSAPDYNYLAYFAFYIRKTTNKKRKTTTKKKKTLHDIYRNI